LYLGESQESALHLEVMIIHTRMTPRGVAEGNLEYPEWIRVVISRLEGGGLDPKSMSGEVIYIPPEPNSTVFSIITCIYFHLSPS